MARGGYRPGAGRKKDTTSTRQERVQRTIEKEALREQARRIIGPHLKRLLTAQIAHAEGLKYLVTRDKKTGKFVRVTEAMARHKSEQGGDALETIEVWEKDPSVHAFMALLDRLLDKPKEQEKEVRLTGEASLMERVSRARLRLVKAS